MIYFGLWFERVPVYHNREGMVAGGWLVTLHAHSGSHTHRGVSAGYILKAHPSWLTSHSKPTSSSFRTLPGQLHWLRMWSNTWAYGGHLSFKPQQQISHSKRLTERSHSNSVFSPWIVLHSVLQCSEVCEGTLWPGIRLPLAFVTMYLKADLCFWDPGPWSHDVSGYILAADNGWGSLISEVLPNVLERTLRKQLTLDIWKNVTSVSVLLLGSHR